MLIVSVIRIIKFDDKNRFMNRKVWLFGKNSEKPFNSKIPIVVFIFVSLITITVLILSTVIGLKYLSVGSIENNRLLSLGFAVMVVMIVYLLNFWGAYVYMPASSTGMLCYLTGTVDKSSN